MENKSFHFKASSDDSCLQNQDKLDAAAVKAYLNTRGLRIDTILYDSLDSTNNKAREAAQSGASEGTLIIAEEQTLGKGRLGRQWVSPPNSGIWMSLILRPSFNPNMAHRITIISALSVVTAIKQIAGLDTLIKWPNDIIANSKKLCGILAEMRGDTNRIEYIVAGIGINVSQKEFPSQLHGIATSILCETGYRMDRNRLLAEIINTFDRLYLECGREDFCSSILKAYKDKCVTLGRRVRVMTLDEEFEGNAVDISDDGQLLVRLDSGEYRRLMSGDVSVRGIAGYV